MPSIESQRLQCRHIHTDGRRCGSPSLRGPEGREPFCYYHHKTRRPGPRQPQVRTATDRKSSTFDLPSPAELAERSGIQHALAIVLHKIAHNEIDPRRAGLLLYGLGIASRNLPREPHPDTGARYDDEAAATVEDLTVDPEHGPLAPEANIEDLRPQASSEPSSKSWNSRERSSGNGSRTMARRTTVRRTMTRRTTPSTSTPSRKTLCSPKLNRAASRLYAESAGCPLPLAPRRNKHPFLPPGEQTGQRLHAAAPCAPLPARVDHAASRSCCP